jgi:hypothetical protein
MDSSNSNKHHPIAVCNVLSSAATGNAPLSWFGNTFSALSRLSTGINPKTG